MKPSAADPWSLSWETACTLTELGELTARWLTGELADYPAYDGPPEAETSSMTGLLAGVNRAGLLTDFSQPGLADDRLRQRATVAGYCDEEILKRLLLTCAPTDLVLLNEHGDSGIRLPVTLRDGRPRTFVGGKHSPDGWDKVLSDAGLAALDNGWYVAIVDPVWGRDDLLWPTLADALGLDRGLHPATMSG